MVEKNKQIIELMVLKKKMKDEAAAKGVPVAKEAQGDVDDIDMSAA